MAQAPPLVTRQLSVGRLLGARYPDEHRGEIHLVLSDVVMPKLSGPEMASLIAQVRPGIKVLFMSGYTSDVLARQTSATSG